MVLSASERALVKNFWAKIAHRARELGAEALERLFLAYPQTKVYFSHLDVSLGSKDLLKHGGMIFNALGKAANHLDDLHGNLSSLKDLHAKELKVDPAIVGMLSKSIKEVLTTNYPKDLIGAIEAAWDKFLKEVLSVLSSKY